MNTAEETKTEANQQMGRVLENVRTVIRGKDEQVTLVLSAFFAAGHVLLEDVPGVGKTTLVRVLARALGVQMSRIQFTSDLLPADVLGVQAWDSQKNEFVFQPGPIFAEMVLADEINRASPKTQSALLEVMAEKQISLDDRTFAMPELFTVIATQNPLEHHGVYPLPESQLDRFMVRLDLGYLATELEKELLLQPRKPLEQLQDVTNQLSRSQINELRAEAQRVHLAPEVASYLLALVTKTREHPALSLGASTRAALDFAALSRAYAFVSGRHYVTVDDVKYLAPKVLVHRLVLKQPRLDASDRSRCETLVEELLGQIPVPR